MKNLNYFVSNEMKLSSYYQPLIILSLITTGNKQATLGEIADLAVQYNLTTDLNKLIDALKIHPKTVLAKHNIATLTKGVYALNDAVIIDDVESLYTELTQVLLRYKL